jgi:hypothetical protein
MIHTSIPLLTFGDVKNMRVVLKSFRDKIYSSPCVNDLEELYLIPDSWCK